MRAQLGTSPCLGPRPRTVVGFVGPQKWLAAPARKQGQGTSLPQRNIPPVGSALMLHYPGWHSLADVGVTDARLDHRTGEMDILSCFITLSCLARSTACPAPASHRGCAIHCFFYGALLDSLAVFRFRLAQPAPPDHSLPVSERPSQPVGVGTCTGQ